MAQSVIFVVHGVEPAQGVCIEPLLIREVRWFDDTEFLQLVRWSLGFFRWVGTCFEKLLEFFEDVEGEGRHGEMLLEY